MGTLTHRPRRGGSPANTVSELIGHTPLLALRLTTSSQLWLKLEKFNPGQSMKDRMALGMIEAAEKSGQLLPRGTIVESSSGNTGTALAMLSAERGYRFIVVVDHHAARDKLRIMQAYGAEIVRVEGDFRADEVATELRESRARAIASELPGAVYLEQPHNRANGTAYEDTLAQELFDGLGGDVDALVGAVGTGGSLCGTARGLKRRVTRLRVVGVEPVGSIIFGGPPAAYYQSGTGTPGGVDVGLNVDYSVIDEGRTVSDAAAFTTCRFLARRLGILVGGSAGGVLYEAITIASVTTKSVVALVGDGGEKYLDTVFDDEWIRARGLHDADVDEMLAKLLVTRS
jgi:cystathionine beta-synthase